MNALNQPITVDPAKLHISGYLCRLNISCWEGKKKDNEASRDLEKKHKAQVGAADAYKRLVPVDKVNNYTKVAREARTFHDFLCAPWDTGVRFITDVAIERWLQGMDTHKVQFTGAVDDFLKWYTDEWEKQEARLGTLFNKKDYPDPARLRERFSFEYSFEPLNDVSQLKKHINIEAANEIVNKVINDRVSLIQNASENAWHRVYDVVKKLHEKLSTYDPEKSRLHESSLENIRELTDALPLLNVGNDTRLIGLQRDLKNRLLAKAGDTATLKQSQTAREHTAEEAEAILNAIATVIEVNKK